MWFRLWTWAKAAREDLLLLFFAWRNPAMPRYLNMMLWMALGYLLSPIDFAPDYLPVVGLADDLTVVPALLLLVSRLLPAAVREESERRALRWRTKLPFLLTAAALLLLLVWVVFFAWCVYSLLTK